MEAGQERQLREGESEREACALQALGSACSGHAIANLSDESAADCAAALAEWLAGRPPQWHSGGAGVSAWRAMRNLCSRGPRTQAAARALSPTALALALDSTAAEDARVVALQLLHNSTAAAPPALARLWHSWAPLHLADLLMDHSPRVRTVALAALHHSCCGPDGRSRMEALCSPWGAPMAAALLQCMDELQQEQQAFEWLFLLASSLVSRGLIGPLHEALGGSIPPPALIQMVEAFLSALEDDPRQNVAAALPEAACMQLIQWLEQSLAALEEGSVAGVEEALTGALQLLASATALLQAPELSNRKDVLLQAGLLRRAVETLAPGSKAGTVPGLRVLALAVLANLSHGHRASQDAVRELGGIPLVLNQCVLDETNEFKKEWAVFVVRNLCDGNEENRRLIDSLQPQAVNSFPEELSRMGMEAEVRGGRVHLVRDKAPAPRPPL